MANINGCCSKEALLDNGSQIISMSREVAMSAHISWDPNAAILMQSASGHTEKTCGLAKDVPFYLEGIVVYLQVHILPNPPYQVLLGQPFDVLIQSQVQNTTDGGQTLILTNPNTGKRAVVPTYLKGQAPRILKKAQEPVISEVLSIAATHFTNDEIRMIYLQKSFQGDNRISDYDKIVFGNYLSQLATLLSHQHMVTAVEEIKSCDLLHQLTGKKYKPVALEVHPVLGELPQEFRIIRNITGDPLARMHELLVHPPDYTPRGRYTWGQLELMDQAHDLNFLWPEERKLMHHLISMQNEAFAWDDSERGRFKEEFFPPIEIPMVPHTPWVERNLGMMSASLLQCMKYAGGTFSGPKMTICTDKITIVGFDSTIRPPTGMRMDLISLRLKTSSIS
ncbi:hypothetical protein AN958_12252 [Leucoagaricus sp. SymC.cos]|nr:hypothetical protein AN958_12252 [Leucoagaricus sp. SymC.cos]